MRQDVCGCSPKPGSSSSAITFLIVAEIQPCRERTRSDSTREQQQLARNEVLFDYGSEHSLTRELGSFFLRLRVLDGALDVHLVADSE